MPSLINFAALSNVSPLVLRELRAESRRSVNFWLRVLAAAVMVVAFVGFAVSTEIEQSRWGPSLFEVLTRGLLFAIWIVVPLMTADCISSEKREGTLGLLFLTPLKIQDVLLGKAATHILRATTVVLAALPLVVLPLVLGGVSAEQLVTAIGILVNALLLGIAAGLYSSAKGGSAIQVMVWAECYAFLLAVASLIWNILMRAFPTHDLIIRMLLNVLFSVVFFYAMLTASIDVLRETWDKDVAAVERPQWVAMFSDSSFWQSVFHWERGRTLDRNPIAWLQEYSWTARLTKWGWLIGLLVAEFFLLLGFPGLQSHLTIVLSLGVAFSATWSFRRERQTGLLEILLVTPLSVRQLAGGRLWGIFSHFSPALAVLALCWNADRLLSPKAFGANALSIVLPNPMTFVGLMVLGLYLSLWRLNFLVSWMATWTLGFLLPTVIAIALSRSGNFRPGIVIAVTSVFQFFIALAGWVLLERNMRGRRFINGALW